MFDFMLRQYVIQRLLYRLSVSAYKDQFLLKGSMLFLVWTGDLHRPTKDIDLLGFGQNDAGILQANFKTICSLEVDDGLFFDAESIQGAQIKEGDLYQGVRVTGFAYLDKAKISFQVDIGFGDAVTPKAELVVVPSFFDLPDPELRAYSVYTVIAEKFQAMVALGIANSRIKDFYDILTIAKIMEIDGQLLVNAVSANFVQRKTKVDGEPLTIFGHDFMKDDNKQKQWLAFLNKNNLEKDKSFADLMSLLEKFLVPVYQAASHNLNLTSKWDAVEWQWSVA
ncbi:MAG: nucleotidyl transferase AbiEii/AbiGii toxin family protein [Gammaproteobacteria bacterium]|nr:nucleotidyl transferase AbiEii/AbiGii toxin family protein [Gammaproteobacteria bacterium]